MIVNKASNSGRALQVINKYREEIINKLKFFEIYEVGKEDSISEIANLKAKSFDVIVACGGDGTARSVAIGIKDQDVLFGLLPLGSGNDFAKMLGLSTSFNQNLEILAQGKTRNLDVGKVNNSFFINTYGIGFDGFTNYLASKSRIRGDFKYVVSGIKALTSAKLFEATIDSEEGSNSYKTLMVILANGKWEGGKYFISPNSLNNDGILELIILKNIGRIKLSIEFIKLSMGKPISSNLIHLKRVKKVAINTSNLVFAHADGENEQQESTFIVDLHPGKIKVISSIL